MPLETLVLVRHGESVRNLVEEGQRCMHFYRNKEDRRRVGVSSDQLIPLTKKGLEQAKKTGEALRDKFGRFDLVVNSGYVRTRQTTVKILEAYPPQQRLAMPVWESHLIRERDPGLFYSWTEAEVKKHFPWFLDYWHSTDTIFRTPPGGESLIQMCSGRLHLFLRELEDQMSGVYNGRILAVAHGRVILGLRFLLERWSYERFSEEVENNTSPNGAITVYQFDQLRDCWRLDFANKVF